MRIAPGVAVLVATVGLMACGQRGDVPPRTADLPSASAISFTVGGTAPYIGSRIALYPDGQAVITEGASGVAGNSRTRRVTGLIAEFTRLSDRLERVRFDRIRPVSDREIPAQDAERYSIR